MKLKNTLLGSLSLGALALTTSLNASAALFHLDFTGVITNSVDQGSALFHNGSSGGQNGLAISGRYSFDSNAYPDQNPSVFNGAYGPLGVFPQPSNLILSDFTIAGQTFFGSQYMGPATQHSLEEGAVQNIPPVNFIQQDIYFIRDASQRLFCGDPNNPLTCNGGELAISSIHLKLFGINDFLSSDALAQPLDLDAAEIAAIVSGPGGGQDNQYLMRELNATRTAYLFNAAGEFNLTSLRLAAATPSPGQVPEPATLGLLLLGALGLGASRRRA